MPLELLRESEFAFWEGRLSSAAIFSITIFLVPQ